MRESVPCSVSDKDSEAVCCEETDSVVDRSDDKETELDVVRGLVTVFEGERDLDWVAVTLRETVADRKGVAVPNVWEVELLAVPVTSCDGVLLLDGSEVAVSESVRELL